MVEIGYAQREEIFSRLEALEKAAVAERIVGASGISLRDWFAGQVLQCFPSGSFKFYSEHTACLAYAMADAMLAERSKKKD